MAARPSRFSTVPLKRSRPEDENDDDDDDDISIASRTPSPPPDDAMDVDKYDEYARGAPREVITVETRIKPDNKGFAMLAKLGWSEGQPLGVSGNGRVDPIPFQIKRDLTGLGKTNQDVRMIETTVSQRRGLDSERQQKETEDQRRAREDLVARKSALENEISTTLKAFYCALCDKQFKNVAQYDEHTNSYAHHHKARFKDMQASVRLKPKEEIDKRKEKERKREEKELRKIAAANGIKMAKPAAIPADIPTPTASMEVESNVVPPKRSGWASVSGAGESAPQPTVRSGWASVGPGPVPPAVLPLNEPPASSNWSHDASPSTSRPTHTPSAAPAFRTAGWTSLDTGSSQIFPPPPQETRQPPPPTQPPPPPSTGGWSNATPHVHRSSGWSSISTSNPSPPLPPSHVAPTVPEPPPPTLPPQPAQPVRSGWQQFQNSGSKRR